MSDFDLPDLPSDEELGITAKDLEKAGMEADGSPLPEDPAETAEPGKPAKKRRRLFGRGRREQPQATSEASPTPAGREVSDAPAVGAADGGESSPPPMRGLRGPITLAALIAVAWISSSSRTLPSPGSATLPDSEFSSARAIGHLVEIARAPHPPGSPEHERVREYLLSQLRGMGLEPSVQTATSIVGRGETARAATVRNIVARIPGTSSTGAILITAHYDGRGIARAAGDDGSGVVTILESVRALQAGDPLRNDVIVLLTDAEELGLLGARAFVDGHSWMPDVQVVLSVEMRGGGGPSIMFETGADNGWIVRAFADADPRPLANSLTYEVYQRLPNDTDFTPFKEAGRQGLNFAAIGRAHVYHQAYDSPENLSEATVQHHGLHAMAMLRHLGAADLSSVNAPDLIYFTAPGLGLVTYGQLWVWALALLLVLVAGVSFVVVLRTEARWIGLIAGFVLALVAMGLAGGAGLAMTRWLPPLHPEAGQLQGSLFHSEGWYVLALLCAAYLAVTLLLAIARRWFSIGALAWGAALPVVVGAIVLSFMAPAGAMNLQWPALAGLVIAGAMVGGRRRRLGWLRWPLAVALAVPVLVLLVPLTELLWLAMNVSLAPALGLLMAGALVLMLPALDVVREPNVWWAPLLAVVLGAGFLGMGLLNARPNADRPLPSTLLYALDRDSGTALWATQPVVGDTAEDAAWRWARERMGGQPTAGTLEPFTGGEREYPVAPARAVSTPPLAVAVTLPAVAFPANRLQLALASRSGAEMLMVLPGSDAGVRIVAVNGEPVPNEQPVIRLEHWGEPEGALRLDLEVPAGLDSLVLPVVEHHLRPGELVGAEAFRRPPELAPNIRRSSDRAMIRTLLRIDPRTGTVTGAEPLVVDVTATDSVSATVDSLQTPVVTDSVPIADSVPAADSVAADTAAPGAETTGGTERVSADSVPAADTIPPRDTLRASDPASKG